MATKRLQQRIPVQPENSSSSFSPKKTWIIIIAGIVVLTLILLLLAPWFGQTAGKAIAPRAGTSTPSTVYTLTETTPVKATAVPPFEPGVSFSLNAKKHNLKIMKHPAGSTAITYRFDGKDYTLEEGKETILVVDGSTLFLTIIRVDLYHNIIISLTSSAPPEEKDELPPEEPEKQQRTTLQKSEETKIVVVTLNQPGDQQQLEATENSPITLFIGGNEYQVTAVLLEKVVLGQKAAGKVTISKGEVVVYSKLSFLSQENEKKQLDLNQDGVNELELTWIETMTAEPPAPKKMKLAFEYLFPTPCTDSDQLNLAQKGTVTVVSASGTATHEDACQSSTAVLEYFCSGKAMGSKTLSCAKGTSCEDGACLTPPNLPPEFVELIDQSTQVGTEFTLIVQAKDADGTIPIVGMDKSTSPYGSVLKDNADGTGTFTWTPKQAGKSFVKFTASDGKNTVEKVITITVAAKESAPKETPPEKVKSKKGDLDGNGVVDINDINALIDCWSAGNCLGSADINCDGSIDINDVNYLIDQWSAGVAEVSCP